jgi:signal transduction histidine kinase
LITYQGERAILGVVTEITERKQVEEELRRRTAELEERNKELDAFAHTVAHDLQNPLGMLSGFAEMLVQSHATLPDKEFLRYLRAITRTARRMSNIIDELLLLAGVRKVDVEAMPLDMARLVDGAEQRLADMIERYQAEVILPGTWPVALGYGPWVEEIWVNYLSNALRYGGRPPRIELGADQVKDGPAGQPMIRFWIRDNGPGLTPEEQAKLFVPFTQLAQVEIKGHGLGLSIVQRIVDKLGGQAGVESEPGQGSLFWFSLPAP